MTPVAHVGYPCVWFPISTPANVRLQPSSVGRFNCMLVRSMRSDRAAVVLLKDGGASDFVEEMPPFSWHGWANPESHVLRIGPAQAIIGPHSGKGLGGPGLKMEWSCKLITGGPSDWDKLDMTERRSWSIRDFAVTLNGHIEADEWSERLQPCVTSGSILLATADALVLYLTSFD